ncbi:MAG: hypothetical protein JNG86_08465 [Verrucomicrobiaceae bacterium]|nr:hypothetical protein [Verrucomicrobiaceae bacterium]
MILEPSHEPRVLAGDAFDRMRLDPEVKEFRRRLITGTCIVVVMLVVVMLINWISGGSKPAETAKSSVPPTSVSITEALEDAEPPPVSPGNLVFKPLGKDEFERTEASAPSATAGTPLGIDAALSVEVLRKFLAASDWRARMAWCRPQAGLEQKMAAYHANHADGPVAYDNIIESREEKNGFLQHTIIFEGGGRRQAHVQKTESGPRVDWESFIGLGEMSWSDFMNQRTASDTRMRVMVKGGHYYANQFGSPRLLACLELKNVSEPGAPMIHGYLERDSLIATKIESWQRQAGGAETPMILRLRYPVDSRSETQVWVTDAVCPGWLLE